MANMRDIMLLALKRDPREPYTASCNPDWLQSAKTKMENRMATTESNLHNRELDRALAKLRDGWKNASDEQKKWLMETLHDDFGLSLANMRMLLDLGPGQMRYAWYKLCHEH